MPRQFTLQALPSINTTFRAKAVLRQIYKRSPRLQGQAHRLKDAAIYQLARAALRIAKNYPLDRALATADTLGDLAYRCLGRTRRLALENLEMVMGDKLSKTEREDIIRQSLRGFTKSFIEMAKIEDIRPQLAEYTHMTCEPAAEKVLRAGCIVCSAHLGNWELLAAHLVQVQGLPVAAVARRLDDPGLNKLLVDFRASNGVDTILRESPAASRQLISALKGGGLLAMLIDQDTRVPSITAPFLGRPARTPVAPAKLAVRRNLPILVAYSIRRPQGGIEIVVKGPLVPNPNAEKHAAILELTTAANELIGQGILDNPTQWPWWHRRWRRPPQPRLDPDAMI